MAGNGPVFGTPLQELGTAARSRISATSPLSHARALFHVYRQGEVMQSPVLPRRRKKKRRRGWRRKKWGGGRKEEEEEEEEEGGSRSYRDVRSPWLTMLRRACVFTCTRLCLGALEGLSLSPGFFPALRAWDGSRGPLSSNEIYVTERSRESSPISSPLRTKRRAPDEA